MTTTPTPTDGARTIELGSTKIGDAYTLPGHPAKDRQELFGYLDPCTATAYLGEHEADRFCSLVNGHRVDDRLRVPNGRGFDDYHITDLAHVELHQLITTTAAFGVQGAACVNKSTCIPIFNNETLVGSFRTIFSLCLATRGQFCVVQWQTVTVDLFPNGTCAPRSTPTTLTIAFC